MVKTFLSKSNKGLGTPSIPFLLNMVSPSLLKLKKILLRKQILISTLF